MKSPNQFLTFILLCTATLLSALFVTSKYFSKQLPNNPPLQLLNNFVSWDSAVEKIKNCEVREIYQSHNLEVRLLLNNKSLITTKEPVIDEVFKYTRAAKDRCHIIEVTE